MFAPQLVIACRRQLVGLLPPLRQQDGGGTRVVPPHQLDDADYRQLQVTLALKPRAGDIIRGSGGLRKIRWAARGRGKSGGIRVIYYLVADEEIYFLFAYAKNKQEDLDNVQLRILRNLVREEFKLKKQCLPSWSKASSKPDKSTVAQSAQRAEPLSERLMCSISGVVWG